VCQRNKASNQLPGGLLQPLPVPSGKWEQMTMDLITDLPVTKHGHDAVVTFVDRLTKQVHFAATTKSVTAVELAGIFRRVVFRQHGMPRAIITDRDDRFMSNFWRAFFQAVGTELKFSTAYHPQTDGQSERANRTLEQCLRMYVGPRQDDWDELLDVVEFAINDSNNPSTGYSPFYLMYGMNPCVAVDLACGVMVPAAQRFSSEMADAIEHAKAKLEEAQAYQAVHANKRRRDVVFHVGDKVKLSTANLRLPSTMSKKLCARWLGPFKVVRVVNPVAYKLKLPASLKIHPVFHVSLLAPWRVDDEHPEHVDKQCRPPPVEVEGSQRVVEQLLDKRVTMRKAQGGNFIPFVEYLVRFQGCGPEEDQWRRAADIDDAHVADYEASHHAQVPVQPRSTRKSVRRR